MKNPLVRWTTVAVIAVLFALAASVTAYAQVRHASHVTQQTNPTQQELDAFRAAVDDTFRTWSDTSINPDLERFVRLWDKGAVKMATGKPTVYGRTAIRAFRQAVLKSMIFDRFEINAEEYQLAGQFGWARGTYLIAARPKAGGIGATNKGTFLTIFKQQADGTWKVYRDTMMAAPK